MSSKTKKTALEKAAIELQKAEEAVARQRSKIKELTDKELVTFAKTVFKKLGRDVSPSEISQVHDLLEKGKIKIEIEDDNAIVEGENSQDNNVKTHGDNEGNSY